LTFFGDAPHRVDRTSLYEHQVPGVDQPIFEFAVLFEFRCVATYRNRKPLYDPDLFIEAAHLAAESLGLGGIWSGKEIYASSSSKSLAFCAII
jgi:hypothetical protein